MKCQSFISNVCVLSLELQRLRCGSCLIPAVNKLPLALSSALKPSLSAPQLLPQSEGRTCPLVNRVFILLIVTEDTFIQFEEAWMTDGALPRNNECRGWLRWHGATSQLFETDMIIPTLSFGWNDSVRIETKEVKWNTLYVIFAERDCGWDVPSVLFLSKNSPVALNYDCTQLTHKAKYEPHIPLWT